MKMNDRLRPIGSVTQPDKSEPIGRMMDPTLATIIAMHSELFVR